MRDLETPEAPKLFCHSEDGWKFLTVCLGVEDKEGSSGDGGRGEKIN